MIKQIAIAIMIPLTLLFSQFFQSEELLNAEEHAFARTTSFYLIRLDLNENWVENYFIDDENDQSDTDDQDEQPDLPSEEVTETPNVNEEPMDDEEQPEVTEQNQVEPNNNEQEEPDSDPVDSPEVSEPKEEQETEPDKETSQSPDQTQITSNEFEKRVAELTNKERRDHGLEPLVFDEALSEVAREKSQDMATNNYFSHESPTYGSPFDMMGQFGISYFVAGENIAQGQRSPEQVILSWMNSEGHRANILSENFTHIGIGYAEDNHYWTQMFIGR